MCTEEEVGICVQRRWRRRRDQQVQLAIPTPWAVEVPLLDGDDDGGGGGEAMSSRLRRGHRSVASGLDKTLNSPSPPTSLPLPSTLSCLLLPLSIPSPTSTNISSTPAGFPSRRFDFGADIDLDDRDATRGFCATLAQVALAIRSLASSWAHVELQHCHASTLWLFAFEPRWINCEAERRDTTRPLKQTVRRPSQWCALDDFNPY
ncbi:hypothetical protein R3P38DRAFT_3217522 [Favolaschia claudopus]|uniref:Uncharacterized protein n=1 Tax=Favolaschia claudopus TaxID=2862362 RepID=A0AAW0A567_9AGAR